MSASSHSLVHYHPRSHCLFTALSLSHSPILSCDLHFLGVIFTYLPPPCFFMHSSIPFSCSFFSCVFHYQCHFRLCFSPLHLTFSHFPALTPSFPSVFHYRSVIFIRLPLPCLFSCSPTFPLSLSSPPFSVSSTASVPFFICPFPLTPFHLSNSPTSRALKSGLR